MTDDKDLTARIDALREALREAREWKPVMDRFHTELSDHKPFLDASVQARDATIEHAVALAMRSIVKNDEPVALLLLHVPRHAMWHGFAYCDGIVGGFFAFDATEQICLCIQMPDGTYHVARMTWTHGPRHGVVYPIHGGVRGTA